MLKMFYRCENCQKDLGTEKISGSVWAKPDDWEKAPKRACETCNTLNGPYGCRDSGMP